LSQNAGTLNPSRGNRRFVLLAIVLGLMGAGLVYIATSRDSSSTSSQQSSVQPVPVVVAKVDVAARTPLTQEMLDVKLLPPDAVSPSAFTDVQIAVGQVTRFPLAAGEQVLSSKVISVDGRLGRSLSFVIPEGKRAFAINADSVQNAGGLLLPGDYVDVIVIHDVDFVDPADPSNRETENAFLVQTIMQNVEVLAVAQVVVDVVEVPVEAEAGAEGAEGAAVPAEGEEEAGSTQRVRNTEAAAQPGAATVTLAVTPEEAERLYLAESNGQIRLAVRPFGDDETVPIDFQTELELYPQDIPNPFQVLR
jgi:pilus assembly protein CpaB